MARLTSVRVFAPAKINLALHVTGQRADGYHLLDSLVTFADVGDVLEMRRGASPTLVAGGPEAAGVPTDGSNLVAKVAALFDDLPDVAFTLTKILPVASGIGGGSADAAAAFRGLMALRQGDPAGDGQGGPGQARGLLALGADIPMCLSSAAARIGGVGEHIVPLPDFPQLDAVLVNPRRGLSTPAVFKAMTSRDNPAMPEELPEFSGASELIVWLQGKRNDMEAAALLLEPSIAAVTAALKADPGCKLARMSGSGATCFGLYETQKAARRAAADLQRQHPGWWVRATRLGTQTARARPVPS